MYYITLTHQFQLSMERTSLQITFRPAMQSFKPYIPACYANNPVKISIFRYADHSILYYFNNRSKNVSTPSLRN